MLKHKILRNRKILVRERLKGRNKNATKNGARDEIIKN